MSRFALLVLFVTLQVCLTLSDPVPTTAPEDAGLLQRAKEVYRNTKAKVLHVGSTVADFAGMYYEDHLKPTADSYMDWAKDRASSVWERLKTKMPTIRTIKDE